MRRILELNLSDQSISGQVPLFRARFDDAAFDARTDLYEADVEHAAAEALGALANGGAAAAATAGNTPTEMSTPSGPGPPEGPGMGAPAPICVAGGVKPWLS